MFLGNWKHHFYYSILTTFNNKGLYNFLSLSLGMNGAASLVPIPVMPLASMLKSYFRPGKLLPGLSTKRLPKTCRYCKKSGHWKKKYPAFKRKESLRNNLPRSHHPQMVCLPVEQLPVK